MRRTAEHAILLPSPDGLGAAAARRLLILGVFLFLGAKLYLIGLPAVLLSTPRLGDDGLVYLWKGALVRTGYDTDLPAVRDILAQARRADDPPPFTLAARTRVMGKVAGSPVILFDLLTAFTLALDLPLKWAAALTELLGLLAFSVGCTRFLIVVVGEGAAGIALGLLAFAILPNQGIFSFIPSTVALALSLLLWSSLLSARPPHPLVALAGSAAIVGFHPVGQVYIGMGTVMYALARGSLSNAFDRQARWLYAALALPVLLWRAVFILLPGATIAQGTLGHTSLLVGLAQNASAVGPLLIDPWVRKNVALVVILVAAAVRFRSTLLVGLSRVAGPVLLTGLGISLVHVLPSYPGELFSRILVPTTILGAGLAGRGVLWSLNSRIARRTAVIASGLVVVVSAVLWVNYTWHWIHLRREVVLDDRIRAALEELPTGGTILYGETEIALLSCLLEGGQRFGAIAYPMLQNSMELDGLVQGRRPIVVVVPNFPELNSLAILRARHLVPRQHGLYLPAIDQAVIRAEPGHPLRQLFVYVRNGRGSFQVRVVVGGRDEASLREFSLDVPARFSGWLPVWRAAGGDRATSLTFQLPNRSAWIEGVSIENPRTHVRWPWASNSTVTYHARGRRPEKTISIQLSPRGLLAAYGAEALEPYIHKEDPVLSDESGLVFFRTVFQTEES